VGHSNRGEPRYRYDPQLCLRSLRYGGRAETIAKNSSTAWLSVKRFAHLLTVCLFLLSVVLPCAAMGSTGNHLHTVSHPLVTGQTPHHTDDCTPRSSPAEDHHRRSCCIEIFRVAFYEVPRSGKYVDRGVALGNAPLPGLLCFPVPFSSSHLTLQQIFSRMRPFPVDCPPRSLYRLHTSLLL